MSFTTHIYSADNNKRRDGNNELPKTQIEDSSTTDKLESIDLPDHHHADQDTDDGESDEFEQDGSEEDKPERKKSESQDTSNSTGKEQESPPSPSRKTPTVKPGNAIIITGDGIMERLMAAEVN